jgi:hypothetical protein
MIEGIHCDVGAEEMRERLAERIAYHQSKVEFYSRSAKELADNGLAETGHSRDPARDIREKATEHQRHVGFLSFIREHLVPGETYRLGEQDMRRLGFIEGGY